MTWYSPEYTNIDWGDSPGQYGYSEVDINVIINNTIVNNWFILFCHFQVTSTVKASGQGIIQNSLLKTGACLIEVELRLPYEWECPYNTCTNELKFIGIRIYEELDTSSVIAFQASISLFF